MKSRFETCADYVLGLEGFWSNDPDDRGGATKFGISLRYLKNLPDRDKDGFTDGDLNRDGVVDINDVRYCTLDHAYAIYRDGFWRPMKCDQLPTGADLVIFCAAVNHGVDGATRLVQEALGLNVDGDFGPVTTRAVRTTPLATFFPDFLSHRARFYADIVRADSSQAKWLRGWFRRLFLVQAQALLANVREMAR